MTKNVLVAVAVSVAACAASAQAPLPGKMEGRWSNSGSGHSNTVEVELLRMETPTQARIKVGWWPYCRWAETTAEFKDGAWEFTARNCRTGGGDTEIPARVRPVEGKNRLEGTYGTGDGRTIYLQW